MVTSMKGNRIVSVILNSMVFGASQMFSAYQEMNRNDESKRQCAAVSQTWSICCCLHCRMLSYVGRSFLILLWSLPCWGAKEGMGQVLCLPLPPTTEIIWVAFLTQLPSAKWSQCIYLWFGVTLLISPCEQSLSNRSFYEASKMSKLALIT